MENVKILESGLSIDTVFDQIRSNECGGIVLFVGTIRNHNLGKEVIKLDFDVYDTMAIRELKKIEIRCLENFDVKSVVMHHRKGELQIGDIAVIIGVAGHHRKDAFEACQFAIDKLKETVPIWKKEYIADGSYWIGARP